MDRTVEIEIGGVTYKMCFTLWAFGEICERHESLPKCLAELDRLMAEDQMAGMDAYLWLLAILLEAQWQRESYDQEEAVPPPGEAELAHMFSPGDFVDLQRKVLDCITRGNARTVGVEAPKNGGGAGAGEGPAPEN